MKRICVFCGASYGSHEVYRETATAFGRALAERELELVYGGSHAGLMGAVADGVLAAGGSTIGVIPTALVERERAHKGLTQQIEVGSMHERKAKMADLADGFVALPGGMGTLDELCEILTWAQLGFHRKPIGLLNVAGYYDGLLSFFTHATTEGFIRSSDRALYIVEDDVEQLLATMLVYSPPAGTRWLKRDDL